MNNQTGQLPYHTGAMVDSIVEGEGKDITKRVGDKIRFFVIGVNCCNPLLTILSLHKSRSIMECTNPILSPFMDRARENQQRLRESLMSSHPEIVREQTVDCLNVIMFFDSGISIEESKILNEARKIITSKGLPR